IGYGIDQAADQRCALRNQLVVFAAKRNDPYVGVVAGHPGDAVAEESSAVDEESCSECTTGGFYHDFVRDALQSKDVRRSENCSTLGCNQRRILFADCRIVGNSGRRYKQRAQAADIWFNFVQFFRTDEAQSWESVGLAASK